MKVKVYLVTRGIAKGPNVRYRQMRSIDMYTNLKSAIKDFNYYKKQPDNVYPDLEDFFQVTQVMRGEYNLDTAKLDMDSREILNQSESHVVEGKLTPVHRVMFIDKESELDLITVYEKHISFKSEYNNGTTVIYYKTDIYPAWNKLISYEKTNSDFGDIVAKILSKRVKQTDFNIVLPTRNEICGIDTQYTPIQK